MSTKTNPRRAAAIKQRQYLKNECRYTDRDIQAFAQLFTTEPDQDDEPRFGCAADTTEEDQ